MSKTTLTIIRHAESTLNKTHASSPVFFTDTTTRDSFINTPDHMVLLTPRGVLQATETGMYLSGDTITYHVAIHSGYKRTKQTFECIATSLHVGSVHETTAFRERENGYTYVMTKAEVDIQFPWNDQYWKTYGPIFARPIGGESLMDVCDRIKPALTDLLSTYKGKNILLITHGRIITMIRFVLEQWTLEELESFLEDSSQSPVNCGVTTYSFDRTGKPSLLSYNEKYW